MNIDRGTLFQFFKYAVYALLTVNIFIFFVEERLAAPAQFPDGVGLSNLIDAYRATIDTAAWVVLLLMFELETYILEDEQFTPPVTWSLHGVRIASYSFIVWAFYGYFVNLLFVYDVTHLAGVSEICTLAGQGWSYAIDFVEYVPINASDCAALTSNDVLFRFGQLAMVVDGPGLRDIQYLAWTDVINAGVWLGIVLILEIDVWLQEHDRFEGLTLKISNRLKFLLYSTLLLAAIYWGIKGNFVDFWDAFLWLVAFFFIEMNVVEWRHEAAEEREKLPQPQ